MTCRMMSLIKFGSGSNKITVESELAGQCAAVHKRRACVSTYLKLFSFCCYFRAIDCANKHGNLPGIHTAK